MVRHTVEIENSTVSGFQMNGIFVNGSTLTANIHDNTIVGTHTTIIAQNGIQVGSLFGVVGDGDFSGTHATIDHNTLTDIGNGGPAGSASGIIVFAGDASGVSVTNNTVSGWSLAAQADPNNGNNSIVFVDSNGGTATGNTISQFDYGLVELDQFGGHLATPVMHAGNTYTGMFYANVLLQPDTTTGLTFAGSAGRDELNGGTGNDVLSGLGSNGFGDRIDGGAGTDTAVYTGALTTFNITSVADVDLVTAGNQPAWLVNSGVGPNDILTNVEKVNDGAGHHFLLVGSGGYATIQAAVDAAVDGDTIVVAVGTYTEDVTITNKSITIDGEVSGLNEVTLNGQITVAGTLNGGLSLTDLNINASGKSYGVLVSANSVGFAGSVTLDDVLIAHAKSNGFAYVRTGNGSTPTLGDTIGAVSILNSQFSDNATAHRRERPRRHSSVRVQPGPDHQQRYHWLARRLRAEGDPDARHPGRRRRYQCGPVRSGRRRDDQQPVDHRHLRAGSDRVLPPRELRLVHDERRQSECVGTVGSVQFRRGGRDHQPEHAPLHDHESLSRWADRLRAGPGDG